MMFRDLSALTLEPNKEPAGPILTREEAIDLVDQTREDEPVMIPYGIRTIGRNAFRGMVGITEVILPDSVKEIGAAAFKDCLNLQHIEFSENLREIQSEAFYNCVSLEEVDFPPWLATIEANAFKRCDSLTEVMFPRNLAFLMSGAFADCARLEYVDFRYVTSTVAIPAGALANCPRLRKAAGWQSMKKYWDGSYYQVPRKEVFYNSLLTIPSLKRGKYLRGYRRERLERDKNDHARFEREMDELQAYDNEARGEWHRKALNPETDAEMLMMMLNA